MSESQAREQIVALGRSMFERALTPGSSANMSIRIADGWIITPTNSCFGFLDAGTLSKIGTDGQLISGPKPSKEFMLHRALYDRRPLDTAVIHLHSTYATLVSCFEGIDPENVIEPMTPYLLMRLGRIALIPYFPPGDARLAEALASVASEHAGVLMANHGPIVSAESPEAAMFSMEELEESAKLMVLAAGHKVRHFSAGEISELTTRYGARNTPQSDG
ncbi:MAG: aldolase [Gammaproteobacteria bacterium]|nr:aldolase [Gammaproteobacteria bacterium]